ncbi:MAG: hypothetical protein ACRDZQ_16420, partial [Acidimicrobiales bacterium]
MRSAKTNDTVPPKLIPPDRRAAARGTLADGRLVSAVDVAPSRRAGPGQRLPGPLLPGGGRRLWARETKAWTAPE